jgi:hypothetical protein
MHKDGGQGGPRFEDQPETINSFKSVFRGFVNHFKPKLAETPPEQNGTPTPYPNSSLKDAINPNNRRQRTRPATQPSEG